MFDLITAKYREICIEAKRQGARDLSKRDRCVYSVLFIILGLMLALLIVYVFIPISIELMLISEGVLCIIMLIFDRVQRKPKIQASNSTVTRLYQYLVKQECISDEKLKLLISKCNEKTSNKNNRYFPRIPDIIAQPIYLFIGYIGRNTSKDSIEYVIAFYIIWVFIGVLYCMIKPSLYFFSRDRTYLEMKDDVESILLTSNKQREEWMKLNA